MGAVAETMQAKVGHELAVSDWLLVDQAKIDAFAACTGDHQWIHVDVERATNGPFGGTIAHGFLTLSLLPALTSGTWSAGLRLEATLNYGAVPHAGAGGQPGAQQGEAGVGRGEGGRADFAVL